MRALVFVASLVWMTGLAAAACPAGSVEVASTSAGPICGRPVVGLNEDERAQVPACASNQTLMRADTGFFLCIPTSAVPANAKPICFNGSRPIANNGTFACRREAQDDGRPRVLPTAPAEPERPEADLTIDILRALGETENRDTVANSAAYQIGFIVVRITNAGGKPTAATDVIFGFPSDAPFGRIFAFSDASQCSFTPTPTVLTSITTCGATRHVFAPGLSRALFLNAKCVVPALAPNESITCLATVLRTTTPPRGRTDLVDRTRVFARVNDKRTADEDNFGNNEIVTDIRFNGHNVLVD